MIGTTHRAGFVHIIGKPNAGKSTLFNALIQYPLSITCYKPQTTRHNIKGIYQDQAHQVVYVDTPGYLTPAYALQSSMMRNVHRALEDSELLLWLVDIREPAVIPPLLKEHTKATVPYFLLLNKTDLVSPAAISDCIRQWQERIKPTAIIPISAYDQQQADDLNKKIMGYMPYHPPYYDKTTLTDRTERFFAADIIRKALFLQYRQEIPYSTAVVIETFQEKPNSFFIVANIYVERLSQKAIIIGKGGEALKQLGIQSRKGLERFLQKKVFLTHRIKVLPHWRKKKKLLTQLGYT